MGKSSIEWTDFTFNPWIGCTKVHAGCTNCYAESYANRYGKAKWGPAGTRVKTSESYWRQPLKWNKEAEAAGERRRVFCASLADVFEDWQGPIHGGGRDDGTLAIDDARSRLLTMDDVRRDLFELIDATPHLDWLLLTKRPENVRRMWLKTPWDSCHKCGTRVDDLESHEREDLYELDDNDDGWQCIKCGTPVSFYRHNVWLGTSISDQHTADVWVPRLLECRDLCPVLFLSIEPLLGPVEIDEWLPAVDGTRTLDGEGDDMPHLDWVIVGGESGPHARPCHPDWARSLRDQCQAAGVAFFWKQWGEWAPGDQSHDQRLAVAEIHRTNRDGAVQFVGHDREVMFRVGKKAAGRLLDGREWNEFPQTEAAHA